MPTATAFINNVDYAISSSLHDITDDIEKLYETTKELKNDINELEEDLEATEDILSNKIELLKLDIEADIRQLKLQINQRINEEILLINNKILKARIEFFECLIFICSIFFCLYLGIMSEMNIDKAAFICVLSIMAFIVCVLISFNYYLKRKLKAHERED